MSYKKIKQYLKPTFLFGLVTVIIFITFYLYTDSEFDIANNPSRVTEIHYVDGITATHLELIEKFNKIYSGRIKVIPINLPFDKFSTNERKELLARSLRSKSEKIDLFAVDIVWGYRFAKWAENLTPYFNRRELDQIIEPIFPTCYFNDSLIAFPFTIDLGTMYYRDDLISRLPDYETLKTKLHNSITWQDLIDLGNRIRQKEKPVYLFPASDYEGLICSFTELILNQNRNFFDGDSIDLTRAESVKALTTLHDLIYKYQFTPDVVTAFSEHPCHLYYIEHEGIFLRAWPPFISENFGPSDSLEISKIKRVPLPHFKGTKPAAVFGGWNLMVSKFSEHKPEVLEFIRYLLKPESQRLLFEGSGALPVIKTLYEDSSIVDSEKLKFYKEQFAFGVHRPLLEDYTRISEITSYFVHKVLLNEISIEEAMRTATDMINSKEVLFK